MADTDFQTNPQFDKMLSQNIGGLDAAIKKYVPSDKVGASEIETERKTIKGNEDKIAFPQSPPPEPPNTDPLKIMGSAAGWIATLGSLLTRHPLTSALNASAAAIGAAKEGDKKAYENAVSKWKESDELIHKQQEWIMNKLKSTKDDEELMVQAQALGFPGVDSIFRTPGGAKQFMALYEKNWNQYEKNKEKAMTGIGEKMEKAAYVRDSLEQWQKDNPKASKIELDQKKLQLQSEANNIVKGTDKDSISNEDYEKFKKDPKSAALADAYAKGVPPAELIRGIGKGAGVKLDLIQKLAIERHPDLDLAESIAGYKGKTAENTSENRAVGARVGSAKYASEAVNGAADMALESSAKFDRTHYPSLNSIYQSVEKGTGDENVVDFSVKNNTLINEYAAAQNPRGVPRVADKDHAREILETAYNKGQYEAGVKAIKQEVANIKHSANVTKSEENSNLKTYTPAEYKDAKKSGILKKGDRFLSSDGIEHEVN
jgi:hypothetical protein